MQREKVLEKEHCPSSAGLRDAFSESGMEPGTVLPPSESSVKTRYSVIAQHFPHTGSAAKLEEQSSC